MSSRAISVLGLGAAGRRWLASPPGRRVGAALAALLAGLLAFTAYETFALDLPIAREEPASFDLYHLVRTAFALAAATLAVAALTAARAPGCALDSQSAPQSSVLAGLAALAVAAAATALFVADPASFHGQAQEDRPLEWASALLLLGAGLLVAARGLRGRDSVGLVVGGGLALALLVMGMEEISWMLRVFGFETPESLAAVNWQSEFNLHNVQTDLSELVFYSGAIGFLVLLPFLRDLLPVTAQAHPLMRFVPGRVVALASAPAAAFNYGHWNQLPIQLATAAAAAAFLAWSWAAGRRGDRTERSAFLAAAAGIAAIQLVFLALGPTMIDVPDSTEYKELFIAFGFAWYALTLGRARQA